MFSLYVCKTLMLASDFHWFGEARDSFVTEIGVGKVDAVSFGKSAMLDNVLLAVWDPGSGV